MVTDSPDNNSNRMTDAERTEACLPEKGERMVVCAADTAKNVSVKSSEFELQEFGDYAHATYLEHFYSISPQQYYFPLRPNPNTVSVT